MNAGPELGTSGGSASEQRERACHRRRATEARGAAKAVGWRDAKGIREVARGLVSHSRSFRFFSKLMENH